MRLDAIVGSGIRNNRMGRVNGTPKANGWLGIARKRPGNVNPDMLEHYLEPQLVSDRIKDIVFFLNRIRFFGWIIIKSKVYQV